MKEQISIDEHYMGLALEEARIAAQKGEVPIGAVIVIDKKAIARGHNLCESGRDPTAHAEMRAIRKACRVVGNWRLSGATLYVTVEPCLMCAGAIVLARIERVVFGCADPKGGAMGSLYSIGRDKRLSHSFDLRRGVMEDRSRRIIQDFFRELRLAGKENHQ